MPAPSPELRIASHDFWFKVVDFLQQNWALVEPAPDGVAVYFLDDFGGVFDEIGFAEAATAVAALRRNGFERLAEDPVSQNLITPPRPPFTRRAHPNGPIYSSGQYWT